MSAGRASFAQAAVRPAATVSRSHLTRPSSSSSFAREDKEAGESRLNLSSESVILNMISDISFKNMSELLLRNKKEAFTVVGTRKINLKKIKKLNLNRTSESGNKLSSHQFRYLRSKKIKMKSRKNQDTSNAANLNIVTNLTHPIFFDLEPAGGQAPQVKSSPSPSAIRPPGIKGRVSAATALPWFYQANFYLTGTLNHFLNTSSRVAPAHERVLRASTSLKSGGVQQQIGLKEGFNSRSTFSLGAVARSETPALQVKNVRESNKEVLPVYSGI